MSTSSGYIIIIRDFLLKTKENKIKIVVLSPMQTYVLFMLGMEKLFSFSLSFSG